MCRRRSFWWGWACAPFPEYARQIVQAGMRSAATRWGHAAGAIKKDEDFVLRDIGRFNRMMSEEIEPGFSTDLFRFPRRELELQGAHQGEGVGRGLRLV